jgi:hypothetical protein
VSIIPLQQCQLWPGKGLLQPSVAAGAAAAAGTTCASRPTASVTEPIAASQPVSHCSSLAVPIASLAFAAAVAAAPTIAASAVARGSRMPVYISDVQRPTVLCLRA